MRLLVCLQAEVQTEIEQVFRFIVRREIEAPARFQAVQTYRSAFFHTATHPLRSLPVAARIHHQI